MDDARVLLVEELDAIGAAPADGRTRVAALRTAGTPAALAIVDAADGPARHGWADRSPDDDHHFAADSAGRAALARWIASRRPDRVLWCAANEDSPARAAVNGTDTSWWPSALPFGDEPPAAWLRRTPDAARDPFAWTPLDDSRLRRARLSLWDGPYLLAPMPLRGECGEAALHAFASAVDGRDAFDLVVLSAHQPGFEALAQKLGVALRVHFVGPAPREAELAWLQNATAALFAGTEPLSCGLPLRAFACGCPVIVADGAVAGLARWCERNGATWSVAADERVLATRLEQVMDGDPEARLARDRGRGMERDHDPAVIGRRVCDALGGGGARERKAA